MGRGWRGQSAIWLLTPLCTSLFLAAAPSASGRRESRLAGATARSLLGGTLDIAAEVGDASSTVVKHGRRLAASPPGTALLLVPAELGAAALEHAGASAGLSRALLESLASALAMALLCLLFCRRLLTGGARPSTAVGMTLVLAFSTAVFAGARVSAPSSFAALLLFIAVAQASSPAAPALGLGLATGGLALLDPGYVILGWLLFAWIAIADPGPRRLGRYAVSLAPLALATAVTAAYLGWMGRPPEPRGSLVQGLFGLIASTGKSIFLYSPPLLLGVVGARAWWPGHRRRAAVTLLAVASVLVEAASRIGWHGDPTWGPSLLLPAVPLVLEPAAAWVERRGDALGRSVLAGLAAAGLLVQLLGSAFAPDQYLRVATMVKNRTGAAAWFGVAPDHCHFIPQFSPLLGHAWLLRHLVSGDRGFAADAPFRQLVPIGARLDAEWPRLELNWWGIGAAPAARAIILWIELTAAAVSAVCLVRGLRR